MLYIKLFIVREKNIGQSAPECPFKGKFILKIPKFDDFEVLSSLVCIGLLNPGGGPNIPSTTQNFVRIAKMFAHAGIPSSQR